MTLWDTMRAVKHIGDEETHLGLFQFVKGSLQTLQDVDDDFDVVLVLLENAFDFGQYLPPDG